MQMLREGPLLFLTIRDEGCRVNPQGRCACLLKLKRDNFLIEAKGEEEEEEEYLVGWPRALEGEEHKIANRFIKAVESGAYKSVQDLIDVHKNKFCKQHPRESLVNVRIASRGSEFPLGIAASSDDVQMMELLVQNGACLNCQTSQNESALHIAALLGRKLSVSYLLKQELDLFLHVPNYEDEMLIDEVLQEVDFYNSTDEDSTKHVKVLEEIAMMLLAANATPTYKIISEIKFLQNSSYDSELKQQLLEDRMSRMSSVCSFGDLHEDKTSPVTEEQQEERNVTDKIEPRKALNDSTPLRVHIPQRVMAERPPNHDMLASPPSSSSPRKRFINRNRLLVGSPNSALDESPPVSATSTRQKLQQHPPKLTIEKHCSPRTVEPVQRSPSPSAKSRKLKLNLPTIPTLK